MDSVSWARSLCAPGFYRDTAARLGLVEENFIDLTGQLTMLASGTHRHFFLVRNLLVWIAAFVAGILAEMNVKAHAGAGIEISEVDLRTIDDQTFDGSTRCSSSTDCCSFAINNFAKKITLPSPGESGASTSTASFHISTPTQRSRS